MIHQKDANKQNFEKAINTRLEKECITISPLGMFDSKPYPVQIAVAQANRYTSQERADEINSRQFSALDVLVKADLLTVKKYPWLMTLLVLLRRVKKCRVVNML